MNQTAAEISVMTSNWESIDHPSIYRRGIRHSIDPVSRSSQRVSRWMMVPITALGAGTIDKVGEYEVHTNQCYLPLQLLEVKSY